jgi:outer membrane biosynthesis protein TonB
MVMKLRRKFFVVIAATVVCLGPALAQEPVVESRSEQQAHSPSSGRIQLSEKEMKKLFVKRVKPEYPPLAEKARIVGKCKVSIVIGADGNLRSVALVYGHPMLAPAAINAAKNSTYRAYLVDGKPVEAEGEVEYRIPD